jgi:hypothetical protein
MDTLHGHSALSLANSRHSGGRGGDRRATPAPDTVLLVYSFDVRSPVLALRRSGALVKSPWLEGRSGRPGHAAASTDGHLSQDADRLRETRDRHEFEALMWKNTQALDKGDGATYASTYTTVGEFGAGERVPKGREALFEARRPTAGRRRAVTATAVSHGTEPLDRVRGQGPCPVSRVLPDGAMGRDMPPRIVAAGQSFDTWERLNGKWLLKTRDVAAKD